MKYTSPDWFKRGEAPLEKAVRGNSLTGFSIMEVLIAMLILSIIVVGTVSVFIFANRSVTKARHRGQAQCIAREIQARLFGDYLWNGAELTNGVHTQATDSWLNLTDVATGLPEITMSRSYTVSTEVSGAYKVITITVNWQENT